MKDNLKPEDIMIHEGTLTTTLYRYPDAREIEIPVTVSYTYRPGLKGCMYLRNGDPGYPDEPPEIAIHEVCDSAGNAVEITDAEWERIWYEIDAVEAEAAARP